MASTSSVPGGTTPATSAAGTTPTTVPGLILRPVRWPEEAALLTEIYNAGCVATGALELVAVGGFINDYSHLVNCDLASDLRLAEGAGGPVAYVRVEWQDENRGDRLHAQGLFTRPDAPSGTLEALLDWAEERSQAVATTLPADRSAVLGAYLNEETPAYRAILESRGYRAVRWFFSMVRPTLDDIPDLSLPPGVEVRPVEAGHVRAIFEAEVAAFRDHWGASTVDGGEERWLRFRDEPDNDPSLWQVAWAGDSIVGMVRPYINPRDYEAFGVRRGWCENISTRAGWRGRGIAKALIARALVALRERGVTEAALGVDAENETGALGVYRAMGFEERTRETDFRRPFPDPTTEAGR